MGGKGWRADTKEIIRRYPQHCRDDAILHTPAITVRLDDSRFSHSASRTTENQALLSLPHDEQRELDAVRMAISTTMRYRNGEDRIKVINLMYWTGRDVKLYQVPMYLHISYETAQRWHKDFVDLTDAYMRMP